MDNGVRHNSSMRRLIAKVPVGTLGNSVLMIPTAQPQRRHGKSKARLCRLAVTVHYWEVVGDGKVRYPKRQLCFHFSINMTKSQYLVMIRLLLSPVIQTCYNQKKQ